MPASRENEEFSLEAANSSFFIKQRFFILHFSFFIKKVYHINKKQKLTTMATSTTSNLRPKGKWGLIVKIILTVASAIAGIFGISACAD